ncbi:MAG: hypothetical protein M3Z75_03295 [Actinomycetota bacterium]|nr:hypothetical protein [Actinomycetota bacterium]
MIALGNRAHMFARLHRRDELIWCFGTALHCGPVTSIGDPADSEPTLLVSFPGGGHMSIEFTGDAPDSDTPRRGAWLELRTPDPAALMRAALDAGLTRARHPGHEHYLVIPGGQVFAVTEP